MMDYDKILNSTVKQIKPSGIRKYFDIAQTMEGVISLGVGEPDFPTPWKIRRQGIRSLEMGQTKYTANRGLQQLRETVAAYVQRKYDITYDPEEVLITVGGSEGIDSAIRTVVAPGDEVIIPQPGYVCYEPLTRLAGGVPVMLRTKAEDGFKLTAEALRAAITPRTKVLMLPFPCNPTGAIMERADLEAVADVLRGTDIMVISDELYAELTYGQRHVSPASLPGMWERTFTINGFSKAFSMTGWRLGYVCGPLPLIKQAGKVHQYAVMSAPTTAQYAAIEAMTSCDEEVERMVQEYDTRRRFIVKGLNELGLACPEPKGTFYSFPSIASTGLDADTFCEKLLRSQKLALVPGTAFGEAGAGHLRASYCYSIDHIEQALERLRLFLRSL